MKIPVECVELGYWLNILVDNVDSQDSTLTYLKSVGTVKIVVECTCRQCGQSEYYFDILEVCVDSQDSSWTYL